MFQLCLEYVVSSRIAFKIWKFWNKAGFLNYRSGSKTFCTVTCYFLWDAKQTGGIIIIISSFWCCWGFFCCGTVELLKACHFLISSFCSHDLLSSGSSASERESNFSNPVSAPGTPQQSLSACFLARKPKLKAGRLPTAECENENFLLWLYGVMHCNTASNANNDQFNLWKYYLL